MLVDLNAVLIIAKLWLIHTIYLSKRFFFFEEIWGCWLRSSSLNFALLSSLSAFASGSNSVTFVSSAVFDEDCSSRWRCLCFRWRGVNFGIFLFFLLVLSENTVISLTRKATRKPDWQRNASSAFPTMPFKKGLT
jgi:hypothetical protein